MRILLSTCLSLLLVGHILGQNGPTQFDPLPNGKVSQKGDLSQGEKMQDLSWAWNSQNACFVSTQQKKFTGKHVLYRTQIPAHSEMTIRLIPEDKNANFSLYAYSGGNGALVPNLPSCVSCEADFKWDFNYRGKTQDHSRMVQLRAVNNPFSVTIGIAGAEGLSSGGFTLEVELDGGETTSIRTQAQIPVYQVESTKGESMVYQGDLTEGEAVHDLSWAWNSQNACFPKTQAPQFQGHHQLYVTKLPTHSELSITLTAEDPAQTLNLYAYSIGNDLRLIPNLPSCVSCEASYGLDKRIRKVELRAVNRPYQVVIGVAGAKEVTSGKYTLELKLK